MTDRTDRPAGTPQAPGARTIGGWPDTRAAGDPAAMDPELTIADTLPRLYRRVLDAIGRLEQLGGRREASRARATAIKVYSRSWDAEAYRQLEELAATVEAAALDIENPEPRIP